MALVHNNLGQNLLEGCCQEAARVQTVTRELEHLRMALPLQYHAHMILLIDGLQTTRHRLGDIIDSSQLYMIRVEVIIEYLNIVLPCLQRTLMDIERYYNDKTRSKINRWRAMYHEMGDELPGTTLPSRFIMYSQFLELLGLLLTKSPNFNMNTLYSLEHRIMQLREVRNIPPPSPIERPVLMWHDSVEFWEEQTNSHWAESIFTRLPPTHTILEEPKNPISQAFGPFQRLGQPLISPAAKILVKRSFNDEQLSVTFFLEGYDDIPHVFVRTVTGGQPWVSVLGAHNLCISRHDNATLNLTRWSLNERRSKIWAALKFITYEEMVLFYCTFICLKARSTQTMNMDPLENSIRFERRPCSATIHDDGFHHTLSVYKDTYTGRCRLHATVHDGDLKGCPVWTAFLPTWSVRSRPGWLITSRQTNARNKIRIRNIYPYIFCESYRAHNQRKGRRGDFELCFATESAATRFIEWFDPPSATQE